MDALLALAQPQRFEAQIKKALVKAEKYNYKSAAEDFDPYKNRSRLPAVNPIVDSLARLANRNDHYNETTIYKQVKRDTMLIPEA
jgi:hypothetical protein